MPQNLKRKGLPKRGEGKYNPRRSTKAESFPVLGGGVSTPGESGYVIKRQQRDRKGRASFSTLFEGSPSIKGRKKRLWKRRVCSVLPLPPQSRMEGVELAERQKEDRRKSRMPFGVPFLEDRRRVWEGTLMTPAVFKERRVLKKNIRDDSHRVETRKLPGEKRTFITFRKRWEARATGPARHCLKGKTSEGRRYGKVRIIGGENLKRGTEEEGNVDEHATSNWGTFLRADIIYFSPCRMGKGSMRGASFQGVTEEVRKLRASGDAMDVLPRDARKESLKGDCSV